MCCLFSLFARCLVRNAFKLQDSETSDAPATVWSHSKESDGRVCRFIGLGIARAFFSHQYCYSGAASNMSNLRAFGDFGELN
jgi:hypothetical protein